MSKLNSVAPTTLVREAFLLTSSECFTGAYFFVKIIYGSAAFQNSNRSLSATLLHQGREIRMCTEPRHSVELFSTGCHSNTRLPLPTVRTFFGFLPFLLLKIHFTALLRFGGSYNVAYQPPYLACQGIKHGANKVHPSLLRKE